MKKTYRGAKGPRKGGWLCGAGRGKGAGGVFAAGRKQSLADVAAAKRRPGLLCRPGGIKGKRNNLSPLGIPPRFKQGLKSVRRLPHGFFLKKQIFLNAGGGLTRLMDRRVNL